jgi:hypothetical protein
MKRLITLCIVLTAVALIAAPVFAEVQNVKVSGDVKSTGVYRENYTLLSENQSGAIKYDNKIITQARVRVDADLTDNVSATVRYLTEYYWDAQDNTSGAADDVDLDMACVTLKEAFYGPLTVTVGRQPLRLGNAFVLGDPDTNTTSRDGDLTYGDLSLRKSFDAVKAVFDYNPLTVDILYSKIDETSGAAGLPDDVDLYAVNAGYDFDKYNGEAELYMVLLRDDSDTTPDPDNDTASLRNSFRPGTTINTYGIRGSMTPMDNLNVLGEFAIQRGKYDEFSTTKRDIHSYAYQIAGDYTFPNMGWTPVVKVGLTHYEGEGRTDDGDFEGWIPLFEDQTHGVVANYLFGGVNGGQNSNADILNLGASIEPIEDLSVSIDFYNFWLDEKLASADNTQLVDAATTGHTGLGWYNLNEDNYYANTSDELGYEVDLGLNYDYTEDVKMGLSAGWFVPGKALEGSSGSNSNDEKAVQVLATLDVAF